MSRKHNVASYNMLDGQTVDMASAWTSNISNVQQLDKASVHVAWTAGPVGSFTVEARNGEKDSWFELAFSAPIDVVALDSEIQILLNELPFTDIRLKWAPSNAVASAVSARLTMKSVGA